MDIYSIYDKADSIEKGILLDKINNNETVYFSISSRCMVHLSDKMFNDNYQKSKVSNDKLKRYLKLIKNNIDKYRVSNFTESYTYLTAYINKLETIHSTNNSSKRLVNIIENTICPICLETSDKYSKMVSFHKNYDGHVCCPSCYDMAIYTTCPICRIPSD
jgi:hypothetical protein